MNSNPNTPVAGLVERLLMPTDRTANSIYGPAYINPDGPNAVEYIEHLEAHIEQLEADKRAVEEVLDWAYDHEPQLIERMRYMIATISNPSPVKGTE